MSNKLIHLALVGILIGLVGNVVAATYKDWDNQSGDRLWSNPANWEPNGLPVWTGNSDNRTRIESTAPMVNYPILDATIFSRDPNGAFADRIVVGLKNKNGKLLITGGAKLTTFEDLDIAYDSGSTGICYVSGRDTLVNLGGGIKVGRRGDGTLVMNGGTINSHDNVEIPSSTDTVSLNKGHLQLSGGTIKCSGLRMREPGGTVIGIGTMDVAGGTLILAGDDRTTVQPYITAGWITAYGGYGTLQMNYNVSNSLATTLTAEHKLKPSPADGAVVSHLTTTVPLSWTNLDPNKPGDPVTVDVWFGGKDPNKLNSTQLLNDSPLETVNATGIPVVAFDGPYYWWVDTDNGAYEVIEGPAFAFYVTDDTAPSVVIDTLPMATWINKPVQLDTTVTDDGRTPVTFRWTSSDPNAVFSPSNTAEEPTVKTNWSSGRFTVTVTVSDGNPLGETGTDSVYIYCASSPCEAGRSYAGLADVYPTDIIPDCKHNLEDLAELAKNWLIDYTLTAPTPYVP